MTRYTDTAGAAQDLWTATILVHTDGSGSTKMLHRCTWGSHDEAFDFINRRLPKTPIPDEYSEEPDCYLIGEVRPSQLQMVRMAGEQVEVLTQSPTERYRAVIRHGYAFWQSARPARTLAHAA